MKIPQGYKQTEVGVIPEDWDVKSINEISQKASYGVGAEAIPYNGDVKYIRITDIDDESHRFTPAPLTSPAFYNENYFVADNDLLIARTGASVGKCYLYDKSDGLLVYAGFLMKVNIHQANSKYVFYNTLTKRYSDWVESESARTGQPGLNLKQISNFVLPVPSTIEEQQKIAEALSDVDELIAALDKKIAKKKLIKQAAMQQLFAHRHGTMQLLGEVVSVRKGEMLISEKFIYGKIPVVAGGRTFAGYHNIANRAAQTITISASGASAGYVAFHDYPIFATDCSTISKSDNFDIKYIYYLLLYHQLELYAAQTGGAQPHVHAKDIEQIKVSYIDDVKEQQAIAKILSDMDEEILDLERKRDKYQLLKNGMMQKLLTGQIRLTKSLADIIPLTPNGSRDIPLQAHIIAGHIVNELHNSYGFGRTKLQKSIHLIVYHCQLDLGNEFIRNTAGPDDQVLMNYIDGKFRQYHHVRIEKKMENGKHRYTYTPTTMISEVEQVYETYPSYAREKIDALLDKIKLMDLARAEIVSTLYAVWNNRIIKDESITDELLLNDFYAWSAHKSDFSRDLVFRGLDYMRSVGLVPTGWGKYINKK